jgi:hypothetical protein
MEIWRSYVKENHQFMIFKLDDSGNAEIKMGIPSGSQ